jgi:sulfatase modifying factor 1
MLLRSLSLLVLLLTAAAPQASAQLINMEWVTVGGPGNTCETQSQGCFGAVADAYRIGTYEVTNAQYATFLNAVAATDTHGLYHPSMAHPFYGGITRAGTSGSFTYATQLGRADHPVTSASWYNTVRFANWLHNGQPTGAQDATTTEDGAYTFTGTTTVGARNAGAQVFVPSDDEWYKAAYYDVGTSLYFDFPAGSDTQTTCASPTALANHGNCVDGGPIIPTEVGSYTGSASPNGTFDQGGNVWEWLETSAPFSNRVIRGGGFGDAEFHLAATERVEIDPAEAIISLGFRVASVAPAVVPSLGPMGLALLASMIGVAAYRIKNLDHV